MPHTASINGFHKVVAQLVKRGANVAMKDKSGNSPLHWAAVLTRHKAVGALLKGGADIDDKDKKGKTARALAAEKNHVKVTEQFDEAEPLETR